MSDEITVPDCIRRRRHPQLLFTHGLIMTAWQALQAHQEPVFRVLTEVLAAEGGQVL